MLLLIFLTKCKGKLKVKFKVNMFFSCPFFQFSTAPLYIAAVLRLFERPIFKFKIFPEIIDNIYVSRMSNIKPQSVRFLHSTLKSSFRKVSYIKLKLRVNLNLVLVLIMILD